MTFPGLTQSKDGPQAVQACPQPHLPSLSQKSRLLCPFPKVSLIKQLLAVQSSLCLPPASFLQYLMGTVLSTS